jgi:hypothetical protein
VRRASGQAVKAAIDTPLALMIVGLGIWIVLAPSSVSGLTPPMRHLIGTLARPGCCDHKKKGETRK